MSMTTHAQVKNYTLNKRPLEVLQKLLAHDVCLLLLGLYLFYIIRETGIDIRDYYQYSSPTIIINILGFQPHCRLRF